MRIPLLSLAGTLLLTAVLLPQAAARTEDEDTDRQAAEEQQKLATLFRAMQGADVKNRRWVVLDVGPLDDRGERKGWLIEERSDTLKLLDEHGSATIFRKPCKDEARPKTERARFPIGASSSGGRRVVWGVRDGDYAAFCRKHLAKPLPDLDRKRTGVWAFIAARSDLVSVILGTAQYSCWADQAGERELASKLLQRAKEGHKLYQDRYVGEDTKGPLHRFVANRFALGMRSRAISAAHSGAPRPEVLRDWERLAAIPYHAEREQAKAMVGHYRSLIAEDRAWREPEASKLAKMSATEKVAYWMHHLRDADVKQSFDPGMCWVVSEWDPFQRGDEKKPNPAVELKKLGMAAVPELIAHLDDARPTRCRGHWRSYEADSYYLLCYGDCCQQVFESITGRTIYERKDTNGYPIKDGEGRECRARAERWWRDYQTKGEKHVLVEGVEAGDRDSPEQARRLVARYPAAAIEPIIRGARRSKEESVRTSLVKSADKLNGDAVTAFLREEVKGPHRTSRVAAAQALVRREHEEGIRALTGEWSGLRWEKWDSFHDERRIDSLISALAGCGIPESVRVLARDFRATPVPVRARIIKTLGELKKDVRGRPLSQAVENAVEELLVAALADEDEEGSSWFGPSGKSMSDPAIGDLAARALVGRWDRADLFDFYAPLGVRQRQRVAVHNVWRKRQGQEPLPLPAAPKIEPVPETELRPLLQAVRDARTPEARKDALVALEARGLPALPGVLRLLKGTAPEDPSQADVRSLARRMALIVREVRFGDSSVKPGDDLRKMVESLRGRPMTRPALLKLLRSATTSLPAESSGVAITLERPGEGTGAVLTVTLLPRRPAREGTFPPLAIREKILRGERTIHNMTRGIGGIGREVGLAEVVWEDISKGLATGLEAAPEEYLLIQVRCVETH